MKLTVQQLENVFRPLLCSRCGTRYIPARHGSGSVRRERRQRERPEVELEFKSAKQDPVNRVYVWGLATTGALGVRKFLQPQGETHSVARQFRPTRLRFMDVNDIEVDDVSCGYGFTMFHGKRRRKEIVMACGINTDSQLGYHEYPRNSGRVLDYLIEPAKVDIPESGGSGSKVKQMSCGRAHAVFLTENGVFSQGNNAYGQCGHPIVEGQNFSKVSNIQQIDGLPEDISKVVCGQDHTLFLTSTGEVYSCGLGADGQTGQGHFNSIGTPSRVKGDIEEVKIIDIASKADCVLAVSDSGEIFGWGNSEYKQLSMVTEETQVGLPRHLPFKNCGKITSVAAGGSICALLNDHSNLKGAADDKMSVIICMEAVNHSMEYIKIFEKFTHVASGSICALSKDKGHVYVWGYGILGQGPNVDQLKEPSLLPPPLFGCNEFNPKVKVTEIKCGMSHFGALTDAGDLYTWGNGKYGCLGFYKKMKQFFPLKVALPAAAYRVECGVDHTVALCKSFV